ncbi:putative enzyme with nucleoside triphosphate hydrolase domain [Methylacidimicrobium sp. AP8]|uniref:PhoH family protein n=1 Tax=Methylacidimicrobium sp. AP8 TaxID=2730359 RepID=UPI0018C0872F|nr:PhoH family protein [Methylacidimicrobium sp. AP8]CAB4244457.1 putative enzyme with nucleoside triphosphate hydrolase domain [Methylacidimicrobium sp. AP8]
MTRETLAFDGPRDVAEILGNESKNVRILEEAFSVKVTTREGWVRIEGTPDGVAKATQAFRQLKDARHQGVSIGKRELLYTVDAVERGDGVDLATLQKQALRPSPNGASILARTPGQRAYVAALRSHELVFGVGPAGTGKTYLAVAAAVAAHRAQEVQRIVLTRPAVEAGEALGFLPGQVEEKIFPYLRPLYDALQDMLPSEELQRYLSRGWIEIAPLAFMRGRTLSHCFVILDEAQNTTPEQMFMLLTRMGPDSRCVVTGDPTQIDLPRGRRSGLLEAVSALRGQQGISICEFSEQDVVRHELVRRILEAYRTHRERARRGGGGA